MAKQHGRDGVVAWQRALNEAVDEVIDVAARESIDAGIVKGGTLQIARNPAQAARLAAEAEEELSWKVDGIAVLSKAEAAERVRFDGVVAAYHNPHCARIQPAQLARGLADTVSRMGVDIYEQSPVTAIDSGKGDHGAWHRHRTDRAAGHRGVHRKAAGAAPPVAADEQLDDRHRADLRRPVGQHRLARPRDRRQRRARLLLRAAHRRQPHRDRWPQRAVPLRLAHRCRRACSRTDDHLPERSASRGAAPGPRRPDRARLVRCAGGAAGLVGRHGTRQVHRNGLGRWICRPRCHRDEPGRPHARRSCSRPADAR